MTQTANYIAFIDLLGTTEYAQEDRQKFYNRLTTFQETISNSCSLLAGTGKVYFFSDCAYIESSDVDTLVSYLRDVRRTLLEEECYLKGAIGAGQLNASEPHNSRIIRDPKERKRRKETVIGHCFGDDVVPVYALQAGLKGVGIRVDEKVKKSFENKGYIVQSCYLPVENNRRVECFADLRFGKDELQDDALNLLLRNFYVANAKSKKYGRYYLPSIISWINSTDFSNTELPELGKKQDPTTLPLIFQMLVIHGTFDKHFADLVGLEYVYFTLLNKIFSECESEKVKRRVFEIIAGKKKMVSRLGALPSCVLSSISRKQFLENLSGRVATVRS